jgi:hypothetical protein
MASNFNTMSGQSFTLGSSISSTQTSILLTSFTVPVSGTNITMATMNTSIAYGTLAPGTSSAELISFTGITQNADGTATLTGVTRGLNKEYPYTEDSDFKQPHAGQTIFILSDAPQVFYEYPAKRNDETITGRFTFPGGGNASAPYSGTVYAAPTNNLEYASKKYVDDTASFGAPIATTSTTGIVRLPTQAQQDAGTPGDNTNGYLVVPNSGYGARTYLGTVTLSGSTNAYTGALSPTPSAYFTGQFIVATMSSTNTGNATINPSSLGVKNIFMGGTGVFAGAWSTSSQVGLVYDGTRFCVAYISDGVASAATANRVPLRNTTGDLTVPTTPTATTDATSKAYVDSVATVMKTGNTQKDMSNTTTTTIAHGLGKTPKLVTFHVNQVVNSATLGGSQLVMSYGTYDGVTQNCNYVAFTSNGSELKSARDTTHAIHYGMGASATADTDNNVAVVTFDATNITLTWTESNTCTGTANINWEALG